MPNCKHCKRAIRVAAYSPFHRQKCAAEWAVAKARRPWYVFWR